MIIFLDHITLFFHLLILTERRFRGIKLEWGYDKVIPLKTFKDASNGYLVDDMCVFGAEVFVSKQRSMDKGECLELIKESITNKFVFRIENYSKLTADFYDSNSFNVGIYKWYLFLSAFLAFRYP